ncbi:PIN domain-containing protein [Spirochaetia bacterium]|nr:PIN domain-containing protein [Spirochaetia bacterium]
MVALIDTNVILDALVDREPFATKAREILAHCSQKKFSGYFAGHTIPDIFYILRKDYSIVQRKDMLLGVCRTMDVVGIDKSMLIDALTNGKFDDVEDCLQAECAASIGADYIITRNTTDFFASPIPAITPEEFLAKYL